MTGTAKVKDDSSFRYKGLTLNIIGVYNVHMSEICHDIYPLGSVTYKLSLDGTQWEGEQSYTVIHESELEDITPKGSVEANVWYDRLKNSGQKVVNNYSTQMLISQLTIFMRHILNKLTLKEVRVLSRQMI